MGLRGTHARRVASRPAESRWVAAVAMGLLAVSCGGGSPVLVGYEVRPAPEVGSFTLTDAVSDEAFALRAEPDQLLAVYLGFTNCPDACPTAMAELRMALARLGDRADAVDVAMITVDPERDTSAALTAYVRQFVPDGRPLRTDDIDELRTIASAFGGVFEAEHDHAGVVTDVGHTDQTYLVDDTGTVVLTWTAAMTTDDIANDLEILLDEIATDP